MVAGAAATSAIAACSGQSSSEPRPAASESTQNAEVSVAATTTPNQQETSASTGVGGQSTTSAEATRATEVAAPEPTRIQTQAAAPVSTAEPTRRTATETTAVPAQVKLVPLSEGEKTLASRWNSIGWKTEFSKKTIDLNEVRSGGPPRDGIPPIRDPRFVSIEEGNDVFDDLEPVVAFEVNGEARAYPLQILTWHEIVNDEVGGEPVLVTFCPLCNTALSFSREVDGQILNFGTSGNLRASNLIMWNRETESWWQQVTGESIAGEMAGTRLTFLPSAIVSWGGGL